MHALLKALVALNLFALVFGSCALANEEGSKLSPKASLRSLHVCNPDVEHWCSSGCVPNSQCCGSQVALCARAASGPLKCCRSATEGTARCVSVETDCNDLVGRTERRLAATKPPTRRPTRKPTTKRPSIFKSKAPSKSPQPKATRKPTQFKSKKPTKGPTPFPTTRYPTRFPTKPTRRPTDGPTTLQPSTVAPSDAPTGTNSPTTIAPTTRSPTVKTQKPTTSFPTRPTTKFPTTKPTTASPFTESPTTAAPVVTQSPTTSSPTRPTTRNPTTKPTTAAPSTANPTTNSPVTTPKPTTGSPTTTLKPTTSSPSPQASFGPFSLSTSVKSPALASADPDFWNTQGPLCMSDDGTAAGTIIYDGDDYGFYVFAKASAGPSWTQQSPKMTVELDSFVTDCAMKSDGSYAVVAGQDMKEFKRNGANEWSAFDDPRISSTLLLGTDVSLSSDGNTLTAAACLSEDGCDYAPGDWAIHNYELNTQTQTWARTQVVNAKANTGAINAARTKMSGNGLTMALFSEDYYDPLWSDIYTRTARTASWAKQARISFGSASNQGKFSIDFSFDGNTALVVPMIIPADGLGTGSNVVSVLIYTRVGGSWSIQQTLRNRVSTPDYFVEAALSSSGTTAVVSYSIGKIFVFDRNTATNVWTEKTAITLPTGTQDVAPTNCKFYFYHVQISGDGSTMAVGPLDSCGDPDLFSTTGGDLRGSILLYTRT